jgi:hypothetical protein
VIAGLFLIICFIMRHRRRRQGGRGTYGGSTADNAEAKAPGTKTEVAVSSTQETVLPIEPSQLGRSNLTGAPNNLQLLQDAHLTAVQAAQPWMPPPGALRWHPAELASYSNTNQLGGESYSIHHQPGPLTTGEAVPPEEAIRDWQDRADASSSSPQSPGLRPQDGVSRLQQLRSRHTSMQVEVERLGRLVALREEEQRVKDEIETLERGDAPYTGGNGPP